jgi:putative ABC transport system permease protein
MAQVGLTCLRASATALRVALETLWGHPLRSSLTILAIVIGIAAVVLAGAAIQGLREYAVTTTAQAFGANTFLISQVGSLGNISRKELVEKLRKNPEIYRREAETLARALSESSRVAPTLRAVADVKRGNRTFLGASVTGSSANLETVRDIRLSQGRFFSEEENRRASTLWWSDRTLWTSFFRWSTLWGRKSASPAGHSVSSAFSKNRVRLSAHRRTAMSGCL